MGGGDLGQSAGAESRARHQLAAAILHALPGMPVTFQGDECAFLGGSEGAHTARYPMQWDECDASFVAHYAALASLKRSVPALGSPVFRSGESTRDLLSFYRGEPGTGEILAVFNGGSTSRTVSLPTGTWTDAVTGDSLTGSASVAGYGWRYLQSR
jgi:glycosidase